MPKGELIRRYVLFFSALIVGAIGVAMQTKADLGLSSVSCISYVSSHITIFTMGMIVAFVNFLMLLFQYLLFSKEERKSKFINLLLQIPALILFGAMVDFALFLMRPLIFDNYIETLLFFLLGSVIVGINITMQAKANVAMLSCDAFVKVFAEKKGYEMGKVKIYYDFILVVIALAISLIGTNFSEIIGIREGTIIGSFVVGYAVRRTLPYSEFLNNWCVGKDK